MTAQATATKPQESSPAALLGALNDVETKYAPASLFTLGDRSLIAQRPRVAIVGSRKATDDGLKRARKIARLVVNEGGVVVSGLAVGIDTVAHRTAIKLGGKTIAVIGTAIDKCYPAENRALQNTIAEHHLLVSEWGPGHPTDKGHFVRRNRLMALICDGSVIVEASDSSGTLSQGWEMIRLGRPLFILRSVAENPALKWPKEMLAYGAIVLGETEEFVEWMREWVGTADAASF
jgi:DNA processing protein